MKWFRRGQVLSQALQSVMVPIPSWGAGPSWLTALDRRTRIPALSYSHLDAADALDVGAEVAQAGRHQPERATLLIRQGAAVQFIHQDPVIPGLCQRQAGGEPAVL